MTILNTKANKLLDDIMSGNIDMAQLTKHLALFNNDIEQSLKDVAEVILPNTKYIVYNYEMPPDTFSIYNKEYTLLGYAWINDELQPTIIPLFQIPTYITVKKLDN